MRPNRLKPRMMQYIGYIISLLALAWSMSGLTSPHPDEKADYLRGEQAFTIYCQGCHTLRYAAHTTLNTPTDEMQRWFGKLPPDLSNIARGRSPLWLNHFLNDFYPDANRPFGSNNRQFLNVAMPNVLASIADKKQRTQTIHDIVVYLDDIADPNQSLRKKTGLTISLLLICLIICFWFVQRNNRT